MSILQLPNSKSTDSNELPSEVRENMRGLADFVLSQHPSDRPARRNSRALK